VAPPPISNVCPWAVDRAKPVSRSADTTAINHFKRPRNESGIVDRYPGKRLRRYHSHFLTADLLTILRARAKALDLRIYFYYCGIIESLQRLMLKKQNLEQITRYADMFSAMGTESRLRIMQLLLSAHPDGLVVGEIGNELEIPSSTLSHHLEKLKNEDLVKVRREGTFLWYSANTEVLQELLGFLYAECCTRNKAIEPRKIVSICK
jgi:ArsR family transcriptional regulator